MPTIPVEPTTRATLSTCRKTGRTWRRGQLAIITLLSPLPDRAGPPLAPRVDVTDVILIDGRMGAERYVAPYLLGLFFFLKPNQFLCLLFLKQLNVFVSLFIYEGIDTCLLHLNRSGEQFVSFSFSFYKNWYVPLLTARVDAMKTELTGSSKGQARKRSEGTNSIAQTCACTMNQMAARKTCTQNLNKLEENKKLAHM